MARYSRVSAAVGTGPRAYVEISTTSLPFVVTRVIQPSLGPAMAVPSDHDIILALGEDLPVGLWVARAPNGELVYANKMFGDIMGMGARGDVTVGGYAEPYGICTRDGAPYPEDRLPFV